MRGASHLAVGSEREADPLTHLAVDLETAARMLGVSKRMVERLRDSGKLRCLRIGNRWRVRIEELNAYLRREEAQSRVNP